MQIILASAKIMRQQVDVTPPITSRPLFQQSVAQFAVELSQMPPADLAKALHCSKDIALENHQRYQRFFNEAERLPAVLAYFGQAYKYLNAHDFGNGDYQFAQEHLTLLSFLYGMLRPLDAIHPYRLEGKVKLQATSGLTLFDWWKDQLTNVLIERVKADDGILLHLATAEFEHLFHWKRVEQQVTVIKPLFLVDKGLEYKVVSMYAKGCRGAMARYVIKNKLTRQESLRCFSVDGFEYKPNMGDARHPHYIKQ